MRKYVVCKKESLAKALLCKDRPRHRSERECVLDLVSDPVRVEYFRGDISHSAYQASAM